MGDNECLKTVQVQSSTTKVSVVGTTLQNSKEVMKYYKEDKETTEGSV